MRFPYSGGWQFGGCASQRHPGYGGDPSLLCPDRRTAWNFTRERGHRWIGFLCAGHQNEELGQTVEHEVRPCTASPVEQSHRWVKYRYYPSLDYGDFDAAQRFCQAVDEVGHVLRPRSQMAEFVCLGDLRKRFRQGVEELAILFQAA